MTADPSVTQPSAAPTVTMTTITVVSAAGNAVPTSVDGILSSGAASTVETTTGITNAIPSLVPNSTPTSADASGDVNDGHLGRVVGVVLGINAALAIALYVAFKINKRIRARKDDETKAAAAFTGMQQKRPNSPALSVPASPGFPGVFRGSPVISHQRSLPPPSPRYDSALYSPIITSFASRPLSYQSQIAPPSSHRASSLYSSMQLDSSFQPQNDFLPTHIARPLSPPTSESSTSHQSMHSYSGLTQQMPYRPVSPRLESLSHVRPESPFSHPEGTYAEATHGEPYPAASQWTHPSYTYDPTYGYPYAYARSRSNSRDEAVGGPDGTSAVP
ncbi:hypothetical protein HDV00_004302 [Rhizophlyctis rosea]|nr:hypothetical protein HDV00_004302 [Rhizophlyctis rosea]